MTRFAHFHHLFLHCLVPFAFSMACVPIFASLATRFETWVNGLDKRRTERSMSRAAAIVLFSAAIVLVLGILTAATTGAFTRAVR